MRGSVRLAALSQTKVIYFWSHDSVGLGEDGPTHQPVEQLAAMRAMPGLRVIRPADANESAQALRVAIERRRADRPDPQPAGHAGPGRHRHPGGRARTRAPTSWSTGATIPTWS